MNLFAQKLEDLVARFEGRKPSREEMARAGEEILAWKAESGMASLWENPPVMVTATIDDAMGHGLELIHLYARAAGLELVSLGLMQPPERIIRACHEHGASVLGLTVLQLFSDEDVIRIGQGIPESTLFIAGGPAFAFDPDLAESARIDFVAKNAPAFLGCILKKRLLLGPG